MDENTSIVTDIEKLVELVQEPNHLDATPYVITHNDQQVRDLSHMLPNPPRKKGHPVFTQEASFVRYVNEQKDVTTRIYVPSNLQLVAVLNHHAPQSEKLLAGWGDHQADLRMTHSLEWNAWTGKDKCRMTQKEFAEFIEDNAKDISGRTDMVELTRTLQVNSNVVYDGWEKDDRGNVELRFQKVVQSRAGEKGEMELPPTFAINIPCFQGGVSMPITAKLRFEISEQDKKLKLWYELQKVSQILIDHTKAVVASVAKSTGIEPFYGTYA